jgi:hypothetical protein
MSAEGRVVLSIQLDMNTRREESTEELKELEMKTIDLNNKFMVSYATTSLVSLSSRFRLKTDPNPIVCSLGDLRTDLEAKKWDQTRRAIAMIATLVVLVVASTTLDSQPSPPPPSPIDEELKRLDLEASQSSSGGGAGDANVKSWRSWLTGKDGEEAER